MQRTDQPDAPDMPAASATPGDGPVRKRRHPGLAALMSLAVPGLGQLYNAQPIKAVVLLLVPLAVLFAVPFTGIQFTFNGVAALLFFFVAYRLGVVAEALLTAWRLGEAPLGRFNSILAYLIFGSLALFIGLGVSPQESGKAFGVHGFMVVSDAMAPTLRIDDQVMADVRERILATPAHGDIVFFEPKGQGGKVLLRRVIALGGDTIALRGGVAVLNGQPLAEGYIPAPAPVDMEEISVPEGTVFVLADDRSKGPDSRELGPVPLSALRGHAMFVYGAPEMARVGLELRLEPLARR